MAVLNAPTDNVGGVIEFVSALNAIEDTSLVHLEHSLISLDSYAQWLVGKVIFHLGNIAARDAGVAGSEHVQVIVFAVLAVTVLASVWVAILGHLIMSLEPAVGSRLEATIATMAKSDTVNKLLLGELFKLLSSHAVSRLHGRGGREGPA